jgi:hypothetical protein
MKVYITFEYEVGFRIRRDKPFYEEDYVLVDMPAKLVKQIRKAHDDWVKAHSILMQCYNEAKR